MGSESKKLPIIDFSNLKPQTPRWEFVKTQVIEALQEYGCFEATFDEIPLHLRKSLLDDLRQLFDLPLETKLRNKYVDKPFHGYIGQHANVPLFESLGIHDALSPGNIDSFVNLMWPQGHPTASKNLESFFQKLSELDKIGRSMVVEKLGLEKYMDEHLNCTNYAIRVQKYDAPQSHETRLGLTPHTDNSMITILYQNEVNGLEIETKEGDQWITHQPSLNSFTIMVGNSLHAWTNGRVHVPNHRVMMEGHNTRYSLSFFGVPKSGYMVKCPEEMVDEQHPLLYNPFDYDKFNEFHYTHAGLSSSSPLKDYCGVLNTSL